MIEKAGKTIYKQAKKLGVCEKLKGNESIDELVDLLFSPQGIEFCERHNFPSMDLLSPFRGEEFERRNVFIDNQSVKMKNPRFIALFGENTFAELEYDEVKEAHTVILMHGARAVIKASGYAVVFVENISGHIEIKTKDFAKVL